LPEQRDEAAAELLLELGAGHDYEEDLEAALGRD
jgi:hypothetical protein